MEDADILPRGDGDMWRGQEAYLDLDAALQLACSFRHGDVSIAASDSLTVASV